MIATEQLVAQDISLRDIRRYGRHLRPEMRDYWDKASCDLQIDVGAALSMLIVQWLSEKNVVYENEAVSLVAALLPDITRYAEAVYAAVVVDGTWKTTGTLAPAVMLEVVDGRWAGLGRASCGLFDIEEQRKLADSETVPTLATWSFSLCLLPLFLLLRPVDSRDEDAQTDTIGEAER